MSEDFYEILGVSRDADEDEIKKAYRRKAAKNHPDVSDDPNAEDKFKRIKKAKEVLTDTEKRQLYDQLGHQQFEQFEKQGGISGNGRGASGDPFSGDPFGGGIGDIFQEIFGTAGRRSGPRQGSDLRTELTINLEQAYHGAEKQMTVNKPVKCDECGGSGYPPDSNPTTCPECNGSGQITQIRQTPFGRMQQSSTCRRCSGDGSLHSKTCDECGGDGQVIRETTLTVEVPKGIENGQTLRMDGEGLPGQNGGPNGDLLIEITIEDHPDFQRDGADLFTVQPISFPQAVFGDTVQVPTIEGSAKFEIPAGTQSGERFRLRGKGMPRLRRRGKGDLFVTVQIVTPTELSDEEREALEAFAAAGGETIDTDVDKGFFERLKSSL